LAAHLKASASPHATSRFEAATQEGLTPL
jgi:hypothetical protein